MEKVLLISSPANPSFLDNFFRHIAGQTGITIALPFLASYLRQRDIDVEVLDANYLNYDEERVLEVIDDVQPTHLGISALFPQLSTVNKLLESVPQNIKTIVGGSFSLAGADKYVMESLKHINVLCRGEGQQTLFEFVSGQPVEEIKGISYRLSNGKIKQNSERELIENIDSLPFPAWDLLSDTGQVGYIVTSFGCSFPCTFCTTSKLFNKRVRFHSSNYVVQNLICLNEQLEKKHIIFLDDNFILDYDRTMKIFDGIKENGLNFVWDANARADLLNRWGEDFVRKAYESGCRCLLIGVETAEPEILKRYKKRETVDEFQRAFDMCHKVGIETIAGILISPYETRKSILKTFKLLQSLHSEVVVPQLLTPEMGTEIFDELNKENRITTFNFDMYDHIHLVFSPYFLSPFELRLWHLLMSLWTNLRIQSLTQNPQRYRKILSFTVKELVKATKGMLTNV